MSKFLKLKDLADIITGYPFKGEQYSELGTRTVRGENVTEGALRWDTIKCWNQHFEKEAYYLLEADDIVIGMDGSKVGKNKARIKAVDLPLLLAQRVACVRAKENNHQIFLYYLIHNPRFEEYVFKTQTGSSVPHISKAQIENYDVPNIDFKRQRQIASVLSALDDKIELNNKINAELEQMAKTLYDYWFVQFDFPFDFAQGKPDAEGKPYKSSGGKMVYNEVLKREIPEGWEVKSLSQVNSELVRGISPKYTESEGVQVINQRCIRNNTIDFSLSRVHNSQLKPVQKLVQVGDILVNSTGVGTLGRVAIVKRLENRKTTTDSHVTIVRPDYEQINSVFLGLSLLYKQTEIEKLGEGSTGQTELSRENLGKLQLLVPNRHLQNRFESIAKPLLEKINLNEKQNQQLSTLRDWILPMLMNGQVSVTEMNPTSETVLKSSQYETNDLHSIAAEPETSYGKVIPLNIPDKGKGFAKQVLAGKIVSEFKDDPHFTNIKFQKIQFMAEHIIGANINLNYYYQTAGPYDNVFMNAIFGHFKKNKWFSTHDKRFVPLENHQKIEGYYQGYFGPAKDRLTWLFELLYPKTESESEIIATLYAVWNNRIIEGRPSTEEDLFGDFYQWSDRKLDYTEEQLAIALKWLRDHEMEPKGFGNLIKKPKQK